MSLDTLQVRLLGPVDVTVDGAARPLSGLRRKSVLAVMGLQPGETVSTSRLIDAVWGENPPVTAANTLQSHVSYLRTVLGHRDAIIARAPGYVLNLPATATDIAHAEHLIKKSSRAAGHSESAAYLRAALDLWRGQSLSDVIEVPWLHEQAERLEHFRLEATQALVEARLALDQHALLVPELEQLAEQHPFREHIHRQLMLALYRTGRQADALAAYHRLRQTIRAELGLDPSPALRDLEAAILRQDPSLDPRSRPVAATITAPTGSTPAQLPLAASTFTGRATALSQLDGVLSIAEQVSATGSSAVTIAAISGTAGVGKPNPEN